MLSANDKLGPYEIIEPLGTGGMGEVYRARDSRVGRDVAIKTSREQFGERFEREARAIAALNHPNICTLFDVGPNYLVMELVEGTTLAARIAEGPIPLEESLRIARQIADALEAAHGKGIVHRDLKPGNVILKADGSVKVLDFGLAKLNVPNEPNVPNDPNDPNGPNVSMSPTLSMAATQAGVILGTAAYMAPEQARGKVVDKRADIWAFGVLLYEMVTGRRLFQGEDLTETLASVMMKTPELGNVPHRIRPLLHSCLEKDPTKRLRDIGDAWRLLSEDVDANEVAPPASRRWLWPAVAVVLVAIAAIGFWAPWREAPASPELVTFEIPAPAGSSIDKFAVSPDGRKVAYFASGGSSAGLWVRSLDDLTPVRIGGNFDVAGIPTFFWSADSRFVAFPGGNPYNRLMSADSGGGPPETLAEIDETVAGGYWSPDGTILFGSLTPGVWRTSTAGGEPVQLTANDPGRPALCHCSPILLPDGRHFLYLLLSVASSESGIFVGSLDARPAEQSRERVVATNFGAAFVPTSDPKVGTLLFLREDALLAQRLDLDTFQLAGTPTRIASGVGGQLEFGALGASTNGVLAYRTGPNQGVISLTLRWFDSGGELIGETPAGSGLRLGASLSPDGTRAPSATRIRTPVAGRTSGCWISSGMVPCRG